MVIADPQGDINVVVSQQGHVRKVRSLGWMPAKRTCPLVPDKACNGTGPCTKWSCHMEMIDQIQTEVEAYAQANLLDAILEILNKQIPTPLTTLTWL